MDEVKVVRSLPFDILLVLHGMNGGREAVTYVGTALGIAPDRTLEVFATLKDQPKDYLDKVAKEVVKRGGRCD